MSTESVRASAESAFRADHPDDHRGAVIAGCRAAARVAHADHAQAFTIGALADEERARAAAIDGWLDMHWTQIAS